MGKKGRKEGTTVSYWKCNYGVQHLFQIKDIAFPQEIRYIDASWSNCKLDVPFKFFHKNQDSDWWCLTPYVLHKRPKSPRMHKFVCCTI